MREGRVTSVIPPGQSGIGKIYMDQIRVSIARLRERLDERNQHLVLESARRLNDTQRTITILAVGALT